MTKSKQASVIFITFFLVFANKAYAICPVCTILVGAGVGLSRWLGIDDTISGIWIGGLAVSLIGWTIVWCNSKNIRFYGRKILITITYYAMIVIPLYYTQILGHPLNKFWGMDKLILGILVGSFAFFVATLSYLAMKKHHGDHAYFPLQKVAMPVGALLVLSVLFYFLTNVTY